jgi:hypothetical protein
MQYPRSVSQTIFDAAPARLVHRMPNIICSMRHILSNQVLSECGAHKNAYMHTCMMHDASHTFSCMRRTRPCTAHARKISYPQTSMSAHVSAYLCMLRHLCMSVNGKTGLGFSSARQFSVLNSEIPLRSLNRPAQSKSSLHPTLYGRNRAKHHRSRIAIRQSRPRLTLMLMLIPDAGT